MPTRTRRAAAYKQHQYRLADEDDDEDEEPIAGGVLASLSNNIPSIKKTTNIKKKDGLPSSVLIAKNNNHKLLSPPTQALCSSSSSEEDEEVDRSMDDGVSAISCDVFTPPSKTIKTTAQKSVDKNIFLRDDFSEEDVTLGEESEIVEEDEESDPDGTVEFDEDEDHYDSFESEDDLESEESEGEEESYEAGADDDEYDPDEDDESGSEEELDDCYIEEEEEENPKSRPTRSQKKEGKNKKRESKDTQKTTRKQLTTPVPKAKKKEAPLSPPLHSSCSPDISMMATPARYDTDDDDGDRTDFEPTPAPKIAGFDLIMSPELVAVVIDDDDDDTTEEDVLAATIFDDNYDHASVFSLNEDDDDDEDNNNDDFVPAGFDSDDCSDVEESEMELEEDGVFSDKENQKKISENATSLNPTKGQSIDNGNSLNSTKERSIKGKTLKSPNKTKIADMPSKSPKESKSALRITPRSKQRKSRKSRNSFYRQEGKIKRGKWSLGAKIGVGSFGTVHVGMNTQNGTFIAVKVFKVDGAVMKDVRREVELMRSLRHRNIVQYLGAQMDKVHLHIFQEWVPGGSVASMLSRFGAFPLQVVRSYLSQTLAGLAYLHDNDIMHRDIKGSNILVNDEGIVKLADFGASKKLCNLQKDLMMSLTVRGTPYFMAPEVFEEKYSSKADVWGVGCVAYQMATGSPPWKAGGFSNPISLYNHIKKHNGPPQMAEAALQILLKENKNVRKLFDSLLLKCFEMDPSMRPSAPELLQDPFFIEMHEEIDDEGSHYAGIFSPGNESVSSLDATSNKTHHPADHLNALHRPSNLSPNKLVRSKSEVQWKTTFMSPPRPKKMGDCGSPSPMMYKSPHQGTISPKLDSSDWPDWAHDHVAKQKLFGNNPGKTREHQSQKALSNLMDSLALSEDSSRNPFASTLQNKSSLIGSTANSNLIGIELLDQSSIKYEL
jgi:serine/threonine protein kinase